MKELSYSRLNEYLDNLEFELEIRRDVTMLKAGLEDVGDSKGNP